MKIVYCEDEKLNHYEIKLVFHPKNKKVAKILGNQLEERLDMIEVYDDLGNKYPIPLVSVYYFESVDHKVYCYTEDEIYRVRGRSIRNLKEVLDQFDFCQIDVNTLVNVKHVKSYIKSAACRRQIFLDNGDRLVSSRRYRDNFDTMVKNRDYIEIVNEIGRRVSKKK